MLNEQEIKILLSQMTEDERLKVIQMCNNENNKIKMEDIYNKLSNNYKCPHCGSNKICKNGFLHGKYQQFKCNDCKKNYSIRTNTIFQGTHKSIIVWQEYIELFSQGKSLSYIAKELKMNIKTAFFWSRKILKVLTKKDNNDKL